MFRAAVLLIALCAPAAGAEGQTPMDTVQRLFDAMAAHDATAAKALFVPGAMLFAVRPDGTPMATPFDQFAERIGAAKDAWLERVWEPTRLEHGAVAVVWAQYDFHLNGKLSHCGIDSFSLLKTASGWKIVSVLDTRETKCAPSPLGAPK